MAIQLLLVEENATVLTGLLMLMDGQRGIDIVGEVRSVNDALQAIDTNKPDVVLVDIDKYGGSWIDATAKIRRLYPDLAIVAYTIHDDGEYYSRLSKFGINGFVSKRSAPDELLKAVRLAVNGQPMQTEYA